jgi:WD40 repeat protein/predicted amidohydrolase/energy-coupling factor transporter ATP-binding protein EcfA2
MPPAIRRHTRVAVVQLAYHPAAVVDRRSPLEDPLFELGKPDALLPDSGLVPPEFEARWKALRRRIRETYDDQLLDRLRAILAVCRSWSVQLVVFPEYAIPYEILGGLAEPAGSMVVVAGTHAVTREARQSGVYQRLGWEQLPALGTAVCPVLHEGRLVALQPKLNPARPEQRGMVPGDTWRAIPTPGGIPGPLGVMICLDFLYREGEQHRALVSPALESCRFLAVPSLTPHYTIGEFTAKAWEEARRYGRPVLYADMASGGGTSIFVDEGDVTDLRRFPEHAGYLEANDEGVIVADVDLGFVRTGRSTRYADEPAVKPFAAASLVYRTEPVGDAYGRFLEGLWGDGVADVDAVARKLEGARDLLLNAGALSGAAMRQRRLRKLLGELDNVTHIEELHRFTREVLLPADLLPLPALRVALARGAADVVFTWLRERRGGGLEAVEERLRQAGKSIPAPSPSTWTPDGLRAFAAVAEAVQEPRETKAPETASVEAAVRTVLPEGLNPALLGERRYKDLILQFSHSPGDAPMLSAQDRVGADLLRNGLGPSRWAMVEAGGEANEAIILKYGLSPELFLLSRAENSARVAAVVVRKAASLDAMVLIVAERSGKWVVRVAPLAEFSLNENAILEAVRDIGLSPVEVELFTEKELTQHFAPLLARFDKAAHRVNQLREERLREVNGHFVGSKVRVGAEQKSQPAIEGFDSWLEGTEQTALVLGEFGSGKSTTLAEWAARLWQRSEGPRPILCNLAGAGASADAEFLLLRAADVVDTPENRAALLLLIQNRHLLPIFDGFDEMATRLTPADLGGRLSELLRVARRGGRVVLSSRDHYFPTEENLRTTTEQALARALAGESAGVRRLTMQLFTEDQISELVEALTGPGECSSSALQRISRLYPLQELVRRPLLLGMVVSTLSEYDPDAQISKAEVYEKYLARWLEQTRHQGEEEVFTPAQKEALAEALAEQLWRSGEPSCSPGELERSVRAVLLKDLPGDIPPDAAVLEVFGGSFFVREGDDRFRFAHKSFLEFFLARSLMRTLPERPVDALTTRPFTQEVAGFLGELLRRDGDPKRSLTFQTLRSWLTGGRRASADRPEDVSQTAPAAANAVRLLLGLSRWAGEQAGWLPENADLRGAEIKDLRGASLIGADLSEADLSSADLREADLSGARLCRAHVMGARLDRACLAGADATEVDMTQVAADRCHLEKTNLAGAVLRQSCWTNCTWEGTTLTGADVTLWAVPGNEGLQEEHRKVVVAPTALSVEVSVGHVGRVWSVAWSPNGRYLASGGDGGSILVWDSISGREMARLSGSTGGVWAVTWSPDGRQLASAGDDASVSIWDAASGRLLARLLGHEEVLRSVAWSPDGSSLASGGFDQAILVWDAASGAVRARLTRHEGRVWSVAWSPCGNWLASADCDQDLVEVWDTRTSVRVRSWRTESHGMHTVTWSPDGHTVACGGDDGSVILWDVASGQMRSRLHGHQGMVWSVAWNPDGSRLASSGNDGSVRLWDVASGQEQIYLLRHEDGVRSVAWSPEGSRLASGAEDGSLRVWAADGRAIVHLRGHKRWVNSVAWSHDSAQIIVGHEDGAVQAFDSSTGNERVRLFGHDGRVWSVACSPDGTRLASAGRDGLVRIWDTVSGQEQIRLQGHSGMVLVVAWGPDGRRLASGGFDRSVRLWDATSGQELACLEGPRGPIWSVAWSPDGARLAGGGENTSLWLWDAVTGERLARLRGHRGGVLGVAWSPHSPLLATGGADWTVRVWDGVSGAKVARLQGHRGRVESVSWSPDGTQLASGGEDGTVRLWAVDSVQELACLESHQDGVGAVAWSPDGARLASCGRNSIRVWDVAKAIHLATFESVGRTWVARSNGGFCFFSKEDDNDNLYLSARRPETSATVWYLPLGGFREVLYRPDKVHAALAGDLSGDDLAAELTRRGWADGVPWDGEIHRLPEIAAPAPSVSVETDSPPLVSPSMPSLFRPGPALTETASPPGRDAILSEVLALLLNRSPVLLLGPRRAGKTTLLYALKRRLPEDGRIRHVTLEGTTIRTADDLARLLEPDLESDARPAHALRQRFSREPQPVLLLDEVVHLSNAEPEAFAWLRAVGQGEAAILLAGAAWDWSRVIDRANQAPGSSFGNDVTPVILGPLEEQEARRFLAEYAPPDVTIEVDRTAAWIVKRCGGWPFYLQVMGHGVVQAVRAGTRRALVEEDGVTDLYEKRLLLERDNVFRSRWQNELSAEARAVLVQMKDGQPPIYRELSRTERKDVRQVGLCTSAGDWLDDRPFFDWIWRNQDDLSGEQ